MITFATIFVLVLCTNTSVILLTQHLQDVNSIIKLTNDKIFNKWKEMHFFLAHEKKYSLPKNGGRSLE